MVDSVSEQPVDVQTTTMDDKGCFEFSQGRLGVSSTSLRLRLWRSLKYEAVYLHELTDGFEAERVIGAWMTFYSDVRPHSALGDRTPAEAYGEERAA